MRITWNLNNSEQKQKFKICLIEYIQNHKFRRQYKIPHFD